MTLAPAKVLSRVAAVLIFGFVGTAIWLGLITPLLTAVTDAQDRTDALTTQVLRLAAVAARLKSAEEQAVKLETSLRGSGLYFTEPTLELAAARLQNVLTEIVTQHQGQVQTSQQLPNPADSKLEGGVRVGMSFAISNAGLVAVLGAIEASRPFVVIEHLAVRADLRTEVAAASSNDGPYADEATLHVDLTAAGFRARKAPGR